MSISSQVFQKPNLLCIGAQKCGTSWIHDQISEHPDAFMSSPKELNFFSTKENFNYQDIQKYLDNFTQERSHPIVGESTPNYLWTYDSKSKFKWRAGNLNIPESIANFLGTDLNIIVSLRNPVDRAISAYMHHFRKGRFSGNEGILSCLDSYGIAELGFYKRHLENWFKYFREDQFIIVCFDDIKNNPKQLMQIIFEKLNLKSDYQTSLEKVSNPGFFLTAIDNYLTIDTNSEEKLNLRLFNGRLKEINQNYTLPKIYQHEIDTLFDIYKEDIEYVKAKYRVKTENWEKWGIDKFK
jgi:hypothetical protein